MEILNGTSFQAVTMPSFGPGGKPVLTIIIKGTFDILPDRPAGVSEKQIPVTFGDEFYDEKNGGSVKFESDMAPFKPRADIILVGKAHVPGGRRAQILDVSLRVGQLKKTVRVFGDRYWNCSIFFFVAESRSVPQPFEVMDLIYERAFGGIDKEGGDWCRANPLGQGFISKKSKKVLECTPLPNLEAPENLIKSWKDHPRPVGFGYYGRAWMPRLGFLGTYDDKWRQTRSPVPPEDFRFDFHNSAHPDLQVKGYLKGDEEVELVNLSPEGNLRFQLPGVRLSCTVIKTFARLAGASATSENSSVMEVPLQLDTLCLIPDEKRLFQVWRGLCPIADLGALEIKEVRLK